MHSCDIPWAVEGDETVRAAWVDEVELGWEDKVAAESAVLGLDGIDALEGFLDAIEGQDPCSRRDPFVGDRVADGNADG